MYSVAPKDIDARGGGGGGGHLVLGAIVCLYVVVLHLTANYTGIDDVRRRSS